MAKRHPVINRRGEQDGFTFNQAANVMFEAAILSAEYGDIELATQISDWISRACVVVGDTYVATYQLDLETKKTTPGGGPGAA